MSARTVLPLTALNLTLRTARIPLDLAARLAGEAGNRQWPPRVAFRGMEAAIQSVVGGWLGDDAVVRKGERQQREVASTRRAAELREAAAQEHAATESAYEERGAELRQARRDVDSQAKTRRADADQAAQQDRQSVEARTAAKKADAASRTKAATKAADDRTRQRTLQALDEETSALAAKSEALEERAEVANVDGALAETREARKGD